MRKVLIAGNWKMHKTGMEAVEFVEAVRAQLLESDRVEALICPPSLYIAPMMAGVRGTPLQIGAQTMNEHNEGAYTGEISPLMLKDVHVEYVIIGHSERRQYYNETDESVNRKVFAAYNYGLTPIVCVGESLETREADETESFVNEQVARAFEGVEADDAKRAVIAYEPIWAIGTGKTATADDANAVCRSIRSKMEELFNEDVAQSVRIQYGGSVKPDNIEELLSKSDIDGALVGGASLEPQSFLQLVEAGHNR